MKYRQGIFKPQHPEKWVNPKKIVYRSGLELRFFNYFDGNSNIIQVASEEMCIPYISPLDGKPHRYFPDLMFVVKDINGNHVKYVAEIKPDSQTTPPKPGKKKVKTFMQEAMTYAVNEAKWEAASKWCEKNGFKFIKLTEKDIKVNE